MLLRRVTKHVHDQNWFAVGIDFLIVVIGVFIGLQVANWNERQADKRIGEEYVSRLYAELEITEETFQRNIVFTDWVIDNTTRALNDLEFNADSLTGDVLVSSFVAAHEIVGYVNRDVYDELLSVGALNKIDDLKMRTHLQDFYQIEQELFDMGVTENSYQSDLRRALPHDVIEILRQSCSARYTDENSVLTRLPRLREDCEEELTEEQLSRALADLSDADLKHSLREALGDYKNKKRDFEDVLRKVRELRAFMKESRK